VFLTVGLDLLPQGYVISECALGNVGQCPFIREFRQSITAHEASDPRTTGVFRPASIRSPVFQIRLQQALCRREFPLDS
jgi:hypothetical protein